MVDTTRDPASDVTRGAVPTVAPATPVAPRARTTGPLHLVVGVEGTTPRRRAVDIGSQVIGEPVIPGWHDVVLLAQLDDLARPIDDGEWLMGFRGVALEPGAVVLLPTSVAAVLRGFPRWITTGRLPFGVIVLLGVFAAVVWWALLIVLAVGLVRLLSFKRRVTFTKRSVRGEADDGPVDVREPFKLRAKIRASRGSQSRKRKVKASLCIVDGDKVQRTIDFGEDTQSLLRFAQTLRRELGLTVRDDIKLDGVVVTDLDA